MTDNEELNKLIGRKVSVIKTPAMGKYSVASYTLSPEETLVEEVKKLYSGNVRIWLPDTLNYLTDYLNVCVSENNDGSFEVSWIG